MKLFSKQQIAGAVRARDLYEKLFTLLHQILDQL
jgi:hypothetical protein